MTQDEIIQLAKDAGLRINVRGTYFFVGFSELSDLLNAAITKEKEACANQVPTPPQRTWVGLTDEEIDSCFEDHGWSPNKDYYPVIKNIEAKLKEKNT